jgi:PIN like domain
MVARFFVDENDLAPGKALAALSGDVVYPGHPELPEVPRQTEDDVWLEVVGRRQRVVITRDKKIRYRPVEKQAWVTYRVRGFVLTGRGSQATADSLAVLQTHRTSIDEIVVANPHGPWMFALTSGALRPIPLL